MKTIKEWLEELPEPYRTQALENTENPLCRNKAYEYYDGRGVGNLSSAICFGFIWDRTPQGCTYWKGVKEDAEKGAVKAPETPTTPTRKLFDLEAAKAGKPAVFGNGTPVHRFLAFDFKASGYPILASYLDENKQEMLVSLTEKGEYNLHGSCDGGQRDVFMAPEKVTAWMNFYKNDDSITTGQVHRTEAEARGVPGLNTKAYLGTYSIEITL